MLEKEKLLEVIFTVSLVGTLVIGMLRLIELSADAGWFAALVAWVLVAVGSAVSSFIILMRCSATVRAMVKNKLDKFLA